MGANERIGEKLIHMTFLHREAGFSHHAYEEELLPYEYLRAGDLRSVEASVNLFNGNCVGHLSDDPLRNKQFLFVAATTMATRFAMEGGMAQEEAYNLSDLFIQSVDRCRTVEEVSALHRSMIEEFTQRVSHLQKNRRCSRPILLALDYIDLHLHQALCAGEIAVHVGLSRSYLCVLFHRETGLSLSDFIRCRRIEAAKSMLKYSDCSIQEIGNYLAFNSQSHFVSVFKKQSGMTPGAYRKENFRCNWNKKPLGTIDF